MRLESRSSRAAYHCSDLSIIPIFHRSLPISYWTKVQYTALPIFSRTIARLSGSVKKVTQHNRKRQSMRYSVFNAVISLALAGVGFEMSPPTVA